MWSARIVARKASNMACTVRLRGTFLRNYGRKLITSFRKEKGIFRDPEGDLRVVGSGNIFEGIDDHKEGRCRREGSTCASPSGHGIRSQQGASSWEHVGRPFGDIEVRISPLFRSTRGVGKYGRMEE